MTRPNEPHDHNTGLTFAPAYDKTTELDSREIEPVTLPSADLAKLEYFQRQVARRTTIARVVLLTIIFGMLAANAWLTQRNYETLIINVDQARLAQSEAMDQSAAQLAALTVQLEAVQADLTAIRGPSADVEPPVEPVVATR